MTTCVLYWKGLLDSDPHKKLYEGCALRKPDFASSLVHVGLRHSMLAHPIMAFEKSAGSGVSWDFKP